jgi:hypothetical protein
MAGKLVKKRPTVIIDKVLIFSPILPLAPFAGRGNARSVN